MPGAAAEEGMRSRLDEADFHGLFLGLGWDNPPDTGPVEIDDTGLTARRVAAKKGVAVWLVICDAPPHGQEKRRVSIILRRHSQLGRLVLFDTPDEVLFLWPEQTPSGSDRIVEHLYRKGSGGGDAVLQRLERVRFTLAEQAKLTPLIVRDRVRRSFNVEKVTKSFYQEFQKHHTSLAASIEGIERAEDRRWYASVLLNRLMFIYFIQRKGFMDSDLHYLRNRLRRIREQSSSEQPNAFYCEFLLPLFHQGLGQPNPEFDDAAVGCLIGRLPYVNGGLFEIHKLEEQYEIAVKDESFERIFKFFDKWRWHLDESSTGADNEISPEILGFIFEQYVNKKDTGTYYTKPDVTRYMATSTIIPALVDRLAAAGLDDPSVLLPRSGADYVHTSLGYGINEPLPPGSLDPQAKPDPVLGIALDGERWCDVFHRRQQYEQLIDKMSSTEESWTIDDAVTHNLDLSTLMIDYLSLLNTYDECRTAFDVLRSLTICDPTVGSGAFLLAALDILDPLYTTVLETARYLDSKDIVVPREREREREFDFLADASAHTSERYWLLRVACLNNLYGVDILAEAAEIAKLRLFLKLIAQLDDISQVEPLPDLDFNIRYGNLLVGIADPEDANRRFGENQLAFANLNDAQVAAELAASAYTEFIEEQATDTGGQADPVAKAKLQTKIDKAADLADTILHEARNEQISLETWKQSHQPFHWFAEFPAVWLQKGFDVVIGNPPYIGIRGKRKNDFDYTWQGFITENCPDLYAVCMERASSLLNDQGRFAMIVMHSIYFGRYYSPLRQSISDKFRALWISAYSRQPAGLFSPSAAVRNAIVIGSNSSDTPFKVTTGLQRWTSLFRPTLFERFIYIPSSKLIDKSLETWGMFGDPLIISGFKALCKKGKRIADSWRPKGSPLGFKATALYQLSPYIDEPPAFDKYGAPAPQTRGEWMYFRSDEERDIAFLITAGRWMFLWWLALGDDIDVTKQVLGSFPAHLLSLSRDSRLIGLAQYLREESPDHLFWVRKAGRRVGNYDLRKCRHITDAADWILAQAWGFTKEQFDAAGSLRDRMTYKSKRL